MNNFFQELRRRNVVRVAGVYAVIGWILAQVANTLEETMNLPQWFDGLIVALLIIGLPIALIFAWAFELTPEGVKRTEAVDAGESITAETGRKLDYSIVAGLVVLAALIIWQQSSGPRPAASDADPSAIAESIQSTVALASVAVLPFADLSPDGDQEYFSDGISEEILNVLVGVEGLDVVSRTSSFQFKGRDLGIPDIAAQLKVRHVVEGSVRKAGDTIRITAQLIDARDDRHLWSETYDRPLTAENIFSIQDEIAKSIVNALRDTLGMSSTVDIHATVPTESLTAYELYLQARALFRARNALDVADTLLTHALEQDPGYAKAWQLRAMLQTLLESYGFSTESTEELDRRATDFAQRALSIEPNSATAIVVQAQVRINQAKKLRHKHDIAAILSDFNRGLEIEPNDVTALNWRGNALGLVGDLPRADQDFKRCMQLDPYEWTCTVNHLVLLADMGKDDEALVAYRAALDLGMILPSDAPWTSLVRKGEELLFKASTNAGNILFGWRRHDELYRAYQNPDADHQELIDSILEFGQATPSVDMRSIDYLLGPLGGYNRSEVDLDLWDPIYSRYRSAESFKNLIRQSGVLDYWQTHGFPPQCKPVGSNDFECP